MAPGDVVPEHAKQPKQPKPKEKRPGSKALKAECDADGSFVFEAHEAWKDFHNSLRHFYEVGELCDVTLKVTRGGLWDPVCKGTGPRRVFTVLLS